MEEEEYKERKKNIGLIFSYVKGIYFGWHRKIKWEEQIAGPRLTNYNNNNDLKQ